MIGAYPGGRNLSIFGGAAQPGQPYINDVTSVLGNAPSYYNPTFFSNPAHGIISRINRLLVGGAALGSADNAQITKDYLNTATGGIGLGSNDAQLASFSVLGSPGVTAANRTSDFHTWSSGHSGGAGAFQGWGINDDTSGGNPIALGALLIGLCLGVTNGITVGAQLDVNSNTASPLNTSFTGLGGGSGVALILTPGAYSALATQNAANALFVGGGGTTRFRKGIMFGSAALEIAQGAGGAGIAVEMARGQSLRWANSTPGVDLEIWGAATGLNLSVATNIGIIINGYNFLTAAAAGATTPYNQLYDSAGNGALIMGGGGGTPDATNYYRNTKHVFGGIAGANFAHQFDNTSIHALTSTATVAGGSVFFGMGTANIVICMGSGAPTLSAPQGSIYLRTDGSSGTTRAYINTNGSTTWTAINTVA